MSMPRSPFEPFTLLGTTPKIKKIWGGAVALSPVAPLVADTRRLDNDSNVLRITDYRTGTVVGQSAIPLFCHTLSFSPDGNCLLALPGGRGFWNTLLVYSEPWTAPQTIYDQRILSGIFHATWLDEQTILIAS